MSKKLFVLIVLLFLVFATYGLRGYFSGSENKSLTIALSTAATDLSPYSLNLNNLMRTRNLYEGLVAFDRNLKIIPALALSWGNLNKTTWEFKLRRGVKFHDGSPFNAYSVVESFNRTKSEGGSQVNTYISTIKKINVINPFNIRIITNAPDPLILSRLTRLFITKKGDVGTGPYIIKNWKKGVMLNLSVFSDYWGRAPAYTKVAYVTTKNRSQRQHDYEIGKTDILVAVPPEQALNMNRRQLKTQYGLEENFLMFNMQNKLLKDRSVREAIRTIFDPAKIEAIGNNFIRQSTQFVAPGVYGYNADIPIFNYSEKKRAKHLFGNRLEPITLDYISTYQTLAEYVVKQLKEAGFSVKIHPLTPNELLSRIRTNKADMFIIGWQAENGDAGDFLDAFVHSDGEFNHGRYKNEELDAKIDVARQELNPKKRLAMLQELIKLVDNELIGVPLFESSRLYAVRPGIKWKPRIDGLVLASEVE